LQFDITGTIGNVVKKQLKILAACWAGAIFGLWKERSGFAKMEGGEEEEEERGGEDGVEEEK